VVPVLHTCFYLPRLLQGDFTLASMSVVNPKAAAHTEANQAAVLACALRCMPVCAAVCRVTCLTPQQPHTARRRFLLQSRCQQHLPQQHHRSLALAAAAHCVLRTQQQQQPTSTTSALAPQAAHVSSCSATDITASWPQQHQVRTADRWPRYCCIVPGEPMQAWPTSEQSAYGSITARREPCSSAATSLQLQHSSRREQQQQYQPATRQAWCLDQGSNTSGASDHGMPSATCRSVDCSAWPLAHTPASCSTSIAAAASGRKAKRNMHSAAEQPGMKLGVTA
jgi:hypothetical protein